MSSLHHLTPLQVTYAPALEKLSAKVADRKRAEEQAKSKGAESVWEAYLRRKKEKKKEKLRQKVRSHYGQ
jgi:TnpA family transposase